MPMHDWISKYPQVQALLQAPDEVLEYAPDVQFRVSRERDAGVRRRAILPWSYILNGHNPIPTPPGVDWGRWRETTYRHVRDTWVAGGIRVSTVFLGIDHNWSGEGPPLLFETIVFGGSLDREQTRYSTWDEAEAGHRAMITRIREVEATEQPDGERGEPLQIDGCETVSGGGVVMVHGSPVRVTYPNGPRGAWRMVRVEETEDNAPDPAET